MQPYFFPYIGYFQLINAVDKFVIYDDVAYIKNGWVNRNKIMVSNKAQYITIPVTDASTNYLINETRIVNYQRFKKKFLKTIQYNYSKAQYFDKTFNLLKEIFFEDYRFISKFNVFLLLKIIDYLKIKTDILISSEAVSNQNLNSQERILDICNLLNADIYINVIAGKELYNKKYFETAGIDLYFIKTNDIEYKQFNHNFESWLSIIDIMMFNSCEQISNMLNDYELV